MTDAQDLIRQLSLDLQRTSNALDTLINTIPVGIGVAEDPECRFIRVNRAFAEQLGISTHQNASLSAPLHERPPFRVFIDGREAAPQDLPMQYAARTAREVGPVACDVVHSDGRRVTLYEYAAPLFDAEGRVRGAIGVFVDITARQRVELEQRFLARAGEILASSLDSGETWSALAQLAVPVLGDYCALDVLREDNTFDRIEFVVGDPRLKDVAESLKRYPPVPDVESPATQAIRSGKPLYSIECKPEVLDRSAQTPEHRELLGRLGVQSYIMVPLTARGRTLGLFSVGALNPARRQTQRDFELAVEVGRRAALALDNARLYRLAQEANELKEEFLATLSHELRTPLNALLGWTHILKTRASDEQFRTRALEVIERNARAQAVLIDDLLDVSRVVSGKLKIERRPVDLQDVVIAAVEAIRPLARDKQHDLSMSIVAPPPTVYGDPDRLRQVVSNLLSNAVKFTPERGRIQLVLEPRERDVQITVSDTGAGIDPAFLPHVFERFRQADTSPTRSQGGLGLGLAIVRHIVELHGGAVTATSEGRGKGTRVSVTLPLRSEGAPASQALPNASERVVSG